MFGKVIPDNSILENLITGNKNSNLLPNALYIWIHDTSMKTNFVLINNVLVVI